MVWRIRDLYFTNRNLVKQTFTFSILRSSFLSWGELWKCILWSLWKLQWKHLKIFFKISPRNQTLDNWNEFLWNLFTNLLKGRCLQTWRCSSGITVLEWEIHILIAFSGYLLNQLLPLQWVPQLFERQEFFHANKSCKIECCGNKTHQIIQNMILSRSSELKVSLLWRTTISGQRPLF